MASKASRDLGLQRISRTTRYLTVGALVAGGALSAAVAKALPGRTTHAAGSSQTTPSTAGSSTGSGAASTPSSTSQPATTPSLTAPHEAPQPTDNPPVVSSGGS